MKMTYYIAAITALTLGACSEKKQTAESRDAHSTPAAPGSGANAITSVIVSEAPMNPESIFPAKQSAQPGDTLTVHGKVMGGYDVFVPGRAIMILGDPEIITSCDLKPDDPCKTPWDVCCDSPEDIRDATLTVQLVDKDGKLVHSGFKGVSGIKELSELVVTGVVAEGSNKENLILNATAVYVKQ